MKNKSRYSFLNSYIIRTPLLPASNIYKLSVEQIKKLCMSPVVSEAIYLASPELYEEMKKLIYQGKLKNKEKLILTLQKYLLRMSNRCTPFGLFSGFAVGYFNDEETNVILNSYDEHKTFTRLDMDFLFALSQKLEKEKAIRNQLKYYPNTTLYKVGNQLRYIEYKYEKTFRRHFTMSIDFSEYIDIILKKTKKGAKIEDLIKLISDPEITREDAYDFINELIDNQIIISSISPSITGEHYLSILKKNIKSTGLIKNFETLDGILKEIDSTPIGKNFKNYDKLINVVNCFKVDFKKKFLIQTDLVMSYKKNTINRNVLTKINSALKYLNKLNTYTHNEELVKFKNKFYKKYEDEEVPLSLVMDVETGIGYSIVDEGEFNVSPLIDDLSFLENEINYNSAYLKLKWTRKDSLLNDKLIKAKKNDSQEIELKDEDLTGLKENWDNLPNSISVFTNFFKTDNNNELIYISFAGGNSATSLLGRFCHTDLNVENTVRNIVKEEEKHDNFIHAEIVHLPEKRVGNILQRPHLRDYEIPYLAKSNISHNQQISVNDIMVSVEDDRIKLRSKIHNKEIIPHLATAHNYTTSSLPLYHFLCDLQSQDLVDSISFNWGNLLSLYDFFPRVTYNGVIISLKKWNIKENVLKELTTVEKVKKWKTKKKIPSKVLLVEGDNELLVELDHDLSIKMFITMIKNRKKVFLTEYLFDSKKSLVKETNNLFTNEIILSYYKK